MRVADLVRERIAARWPWAIVTDPVTVADLATFGPTFTEVTRFGDPDPHPLPVLRGSSVLSEEVLYLADGRYVLVRELVAERLPDVDELAGYVEEAEKRDEHEEGELRWCISRGYPFDGSTREFHAFRGGTPAIEIYSPSGDDDQYERGSVLCDLREHQGFELDLPEHFEEDVDATILDVLRSLA
jgi:hypothetical protein